MRLGGRSLLSLALVPGLPKIPSRALGAALVGLSGRLPPDRRDPGPTAGAGGTGVPPVDGAARPPSELNFDDFLQSDRISLEIGARLIPLVDSRHGPGLLDRISGLRCDLAKQSGLWVPMVRVRDNVGLEADAYRILVVGREVARGSLRPDLWLAIDSGTARFPLAGEVTTEPAFGLPARWIAEAEPNRGEMGGYTLADPPSVLPTHLGESARPPA